MRRLRAFDSINAFFSDREMDELQAAVDARRAARAGRTTPRRATAVRSEPAPQGRGQRKEEGVQDEARDGGLRDEARRLLRVSYERQLAGGRRVTHVDLGTGAEDLGMDAHGSRLGVLLDYMVVMGWVETDLFAHNAPAGVARGGWRRR